MLYELFIEPWTWGAFMGRGMAAATLMGLAAAIPGVFLYHRQMSLMADAISHVALLGIVLGFLATGSLGGGVMLASATASGLVASLLIAKLSKHPNVRADAAIGIIFTVLFALGVVLLSTFVRDAHLDTQHALLGDVLGVSNQSLALLGFAAFTVIVATSVTLRPLIASTFDPVHAAVVGIPVALVHYSLIGAVSVTAVAGFEAVGAIMVVALFVTPAAFAHLFARSIPQQLFIASLHALLSSVVGMYCAVWFSVSAGGCIVLVATVAYLLAVAGRAIARRFGDQRIRPADQTPAQLTSAR